MQMQAERYKAELRTKCRAKAESLQALYQDIHRLIQLAYPGTDDSLATHVGKEAFINALENRALQLELLKREPANLVAALNHAVKVEAYEHSLATSAAVSGDQDGGRAKSRPRNVFSVTGKQGDDADDNATLRERVEQLEEALKAATKGVLALAAGGGQATRQSAAGNTGAARGSGSKKSSFKKAAGTRNASGRGKSGQGGNTVSSASPETHPCHICKELGH